MLSIIMPFYGRYELVHKRLQEFWQYIPRDNLEILVINDCSPGDRDYEGNIAWWQNKVDNPHKIRYHYNSKNLGFGGSMNLGAKHANGDVVCFFSDDVIIGGNFVTDLVTLMQKHNKALFGGKIIDYPAGWNEFEIEDGRNIFISYLNGWFLASAKDSWEESGGFDSLYGNFDYEDVDISTRFTEMGYNLVELNSPYLHHLGGATISSLGVNRAEQTRKNRELYINKWKGKLDHIYQIQEGQKHASRIDNH